MADRVDYLQQMMDMVGHCGKDGFTREGIQEMHGSEFFRTRWRITRCFCPSKEIKGHIAYRIRESHLAICTSHLGFGLGGARCNDAARRELLRAIFHSR